MTLVLIKEDGLFLEKYQKLLMNTWEDQYLLQRRPSTYSGYAGIFLQEESICYEIGCSTGSLTKLLSENNANEKAKYYGIDNVKEMIEVAESKNIKNAEFLNEDITTYKFKNSDLIVSYYTIQFVKPQLRQDLINKIYHSLNWGGGFFLFEKIYK